MEITKNEYVFQADADIVTQTYNNSDNYLIEYNSAYLHSNTCVIYFSSNDIYYPNTENEFRNKIINKNSFEWYNTRFEGAYKHIFLRDIIKQWYINGVNSQINSPQLLLAFLIEETKGHKIITVGSSAGGFAAVLYGSQLNASKVLTFNGQFEVLSLLQTSNQIIDPLLFRLKDTDLITYYDTTNFINKEVPVFYFVSVKSKWDSEQLEYIKNYDNIKSIKFRTSHHGIPFIKSALKKVLNLNENLLKSFTETLNPYIFSIKYGGLFMSIFVVLKQVFKSLKRKIVK